MTCLSKRFLNFWTSPPKFHIILPCVVFTYILNENYLHISKRILSSFHVADSNNIIYLKIKLPCFRRVKENRDTCRAIIIEIIHTLRVGKIKLRVLSVRQSNANYIIIIILLALWRWELTEVGVKADLVRALLIRPINLHYFYYKLHKRALERWHNICTHGVCAMFAVWFWPNGGTWFSDTP